MHPLSRMALAFFILILLDTSSVFAAPRRVRQLAAAKCLGAANCRACKNCRYCKHCAKDGGTCGVCRRRMVEQGSWEAAKAHAPH